MESTNQLPSPCVVISDIQKSYGRYSIISGLSLSLFPGQLTLLLGQNGSGKTTLLRMASGLSRPDSGIIEVVGQNPLNTKSHLIGYLGHQTLLYGALSVRENLELFASLTQSRGGIEGCLKEWNLSDIAHKPVSELSKGQQARAGLARTFLNSPKAIFLDEPSSALDDASMEILLQSLKIAIASSATICVATHDISRFIPCSNRAVVLASGRIVHDSLNQANKSVDETIKYYREINR